jgi:PKD repeat protein
MLNKSILLRYRDYDALLEDLKDAKTEATAKRLGVDLHPELQPPPPAPESAPAKSPLPLVITAVGVVLVIVGILAFFFWPRTKPTASFTATPTKGAPPLTVSFTDTSTGAITNRFWDFGDGNTTITTATSVVHTYAAGAYTVTLVVNGFGGVSTSAQQNYIRALTPTTTPSHPLPQPPPPPPPPPRPLPPPVKPAVRVYTVEFTITAPDAHIVNLAGVFNNWSPTATPMHKRSNGTWAATVQLPAGRYAYKFIVDGKWIPDPENPTQEDDTFGGKNSVVLIGQ